MRIVIVGVGDIGLRLTVGLAREDTWDEIVLVGRNGPVTRAKAALASYCGTARVRAATLDALDTEQVQRLLDESSPDLVFQCASLLSPWTLQRRTDPVALAICRAGFGAQLSAQLPVLLSVMRAIRKSGYSIPVVNCSYPDVTNPILARMGLEPLLGVGNAGMVQASVSATLRELGRSELVRVLAHHSHVASVMKAERSKIAGSPQVYLGEEGQRADELAFRGLPLEPTSDWNAITVAHAMMVIRALSGAGAPIRSSVPGPLGLPGGYPVRISRNCVELDLPSQLSMSEAVELQTRWARFDGIERIGDDGTVYYSETARAALGRVHSDLGQPLRPTDALARFATLERCLQTRLPA